jgi:hypothetical protein
MIQQIYD